MQIDKCLQCNNWKIANLVFAALCFSCNRYAFTKSIRLFVSQVCKFRRECISYKLKSSGNFFFCRKIVVKQLLPLVYSDPVHKMSRPTAQAREDSRFVALQVLLCRLQNFSKFEQLYNKSGRLSNTWDGELFSRVSQGSLSTKQDGSAFSKLMSFNLVTFLKSF